MADNHRPGDPSKFYFACPLCGKQLDVRASKKGKPYVTCNDCSLQLFVRGPAGIERFDKMAHTYDGRAKAQVVPKLLPDPKLRRGRPQKNPEVSMRVKRLATLAPISVLTGRMP